MSINKNKITLIAAILFATLSTNAMAINLTRGDRGTEVKKIQSYLIKQGYLVDKADGILGNNTAYSIKAFQKDFKLDITGNVDDETYEALVKNNAKFEKKDVVKEKKETTKKRSGIVLKEGDFTTEVHRLQVLLIKNGYLNDKADGIFGKNTTDAVCKVQKINNLTVDGIAGDEVFSVLEREQEELLNIKADVAKVNKENVKNDIKVDAKKVKSTKTLGEIKVIKEGAEEETVLKKEQKSTKKIKKLSKKLSKKESKKKKSEKHDFELGYRGKDLIQYQERLSLHGYSTKGTEGIFGKGTKKAVEKFQKDHKLKVTGKLDNKTKHAIMELPTAPDKYIEKFEIETTAYSKDDPGCGDYTKNGNLLRRGYIAVDPRVIPLGTEVFIEGYGFAIADDIGGRIKGKIVDLAMDSHQEAIQYGRKNTIIYIIKRP